MTHGKGPLKDPRMTPDTDWGLQLGCGWSPVMCLMSGSCSRYVSRYTIYCEQDTRAMQGEDGRKLLWRRAEAMMESYLLFALWCCHLLCVMLDNKTREVASTAASCHCKMSGAECLRLILNRSRDTGWSGDNGPVDVLAGYCCAMPPVGARAGLYSSCVWVNAHYHAENGLSCITIFLCGALKVLISVPKVL